MTKVINNTPQLRFPEFSREWKATKLKETANIFDGTHQTPKYVKKGIPFFSVENVTADNFSNTKFVSEEVYLAEKNKIEKGDILITRIGDIGTSKFINWNPKASFYVSLALIKMCKNSGEFLNQYIKSDLFQRELWSKIIHVAFPKKINLGEIGKIKITLPEIKEQQKIADFLSTVDQKIDLENQKLENLEQFKKGISQQIFSQKLRFPGFSEDWKQEKLGNVIVKNSLKNKNQEYSYVETVSNKKGFTSQQDYFENRTLASQDTSNYYIIKEGTFAYNPSRIDVGSLALKENDKTSIVSPLYVSFYPKSNIESRFLLNWFDTEEFIRQRDASFEGSVRNTLNYHALSSMKIKLPELSEQQKIADFLSNIDDKINLQQNKLDQLKNFKKSLLQRMFV